MVFEEILSYARNFIRDKCTDPFIESDLINGAVEMECGIFEFYFYFLEKTKLWNLEGHKERDLDLNGDFQY